ncbi:MAG TPA: hypothetical protein VK133_03285 [Amoebophilaceae bacterium]|nr:hypothetical protein [Amoebophilaceae bacterium]
MSTVSKLMIKACRDNKFSSFTGQFITSINPENLVIKSGVGYHTPQSMAGATLLQYRGTPPRLLAFSLLFDNTGIIPGSNTIPVIEQVKQLQAIAYDVQKKNNAPNYIRVVWGQIDFKGRLVDLEVTYSMFQMDGTLVRAEAKITVLEEIPLVGPGKSAAGKDSEYAKASGASATGSHRIGTQDGNVGAPTEEAFAPTPDGTNGAYSGAPDGAYEGGPDDVYEGDRSNNNNTGWGAASSTGGGMHTSANQGPNSNNIGEGSGAGTNNVAGKGGRTGTNHIAGGAHRAGTNNMGIGDGTGKNAKNHNSTGSNMGSNTSSHTIGSNAAGGGNASGMNSGGGAETGAYRMHAHNNKTDSGSYNYSHVNGKQPPRGIGSNLTTHKKDFNLKLANSLKDKIDDIKPPKLSLWQKIKLAAKKVAPKTYNAVKTGMKNL